ncbi:beta-1,4-galactosyltransferase 3 [Hypomesus transpacificus]|uniref:beta-1,4-galactosyltransferase 3 n=1 Tax=Hypomesus transpacificus TaxID=137520 RepID=UPI001F0805CC|nr:beta-1,4-galactosyltransferase 3 [Hypomesus transpacificus]XP_046885804.1 beta-1,4-galactosyltransferase 3 [Hypomesus transpacificus]
MITIQSKWRYLFMFLGIQLVVMALLSREGYQKRVTYFIRIFRKPDSSGGGLSQGCNNTSGPDVLAGSRAGVGADVYANLSLLARVQTGIEDMPFCPKTSPLIGGPIHVHFPSGLTFAEVQRKNPLVVRGGRYRPPDCEAQHRTAIIIPHRNREHHLKFLLYYLHPFLQRQQLNYGIYVIHQAGNYTFNRAKLMNVGFREAMREEDWDCLFFHDVDLIPEDDRNTYVCDSQPKHAAIAMDKFGYKLPYKMYFGGVSALSPLHYLKMNGFPNNYWGWGGEDDDIGIRVSLGGMYIKRPSLKVGRYKMIKHKLDKGNDVNPRRFNMLAKTRQTWKLDGMNTADYKVLMRDYLPLYTNISVNIGTEAGLHATQLSNTPAKTPAKPPVKLSTKVPAKPPVKPKQDQPKSQHP